MFAKNLLATSAERFGEEDANSVVRSLSGCDNRVRGGIIHFFSSPRIILVSVLVYLACMYVCMYLCIGE